jgi:NitT/TauT family transport system substrate-binding protein
MVDQKIMPAAVEPDKVVTNQFIDAINDYDRAAVISEAKSVDLSKLK